MDQLSRFARWLGASETEEEEGAEDPFLLGLSEAEREDKIDGYLQQFSVLLEYERLQDLVPSGIYVMPCFDSLLTWHGVLFVRQGLYRGGAFKFVLQLPGDYPESPPELHLLSELFHPLVDPASGRVDLGAFFPEWRAGRDYASFALPHLQRALLRREGLAGGARPPLNPEARELFLRDPAAFAEKAAGCASASLRKAYENPSGSPLHFTKGPAEAHERILENLNALDSSYSIEDRKTAFVQWFCEHYGNEQQGSVRMSRKLETIHFDADASPRHAGVVCVESSGSEVYDAGR